jgi:hypothetical protein
LLAEEGIVFQHIYNIWTAVQDAFQTPAIVVLLFAVGALRRRVRALEARTGTSAPRAEWEALPPHIRNEAALETTGQR